MRNITFVELSLESRLVTHQNFTLSVLVYLKSQFHCRLNHFNGGGGWVLYEVEHP